MARSSLIVRLGARMRDTGATQSDVARECGISQPHLSKVLGRRVKLAAKTSSKLERWLADDSGRQQQRVEPLKSLAIRIAALRPRRRMQIMQLLEAVDRLLGG
jgi:transcriptional regulator with XRE-family HTH domain